MDQAHNDQQYDLEKQDPARLETYLPSTPDHQDSTSNTNGAPPVQDLDPAAARLARDLNPLSTEDFLKLLGVGTSTSPADSLAKLALPYGLYSKIHKELQYNDRKFKAFDIAAYALLVVQITISAIFIILGSLHNVDTDITIAVLGAVATVISGSLALMKGQGLPNRFRQTRDSLRMVIFEIEELYWDVKTGRPVLYKDVKKIREDYLRVLQQARRNHPDVWDGTEDIAGGAKRGGAKKSRNL